MNIIKISFSDKQKFNQGFTLIELMIVVLVIAILAAIVLPSYQSFTRKGVAAQAQQEMNKLAEQLQRHKSRNFSFKGFNANYLYAGGGAIFNASTQTITINSSYTATIVDAMAGNPLLTTTNALGQAWAIKAVSSDPQNFSFLLTSTGIRCKNKTAANISYSTCGEGTENW